MILEILPYLLVFGSSAWVLYDARNLGIRRNPQQSFFSLGPTGWFIWCILLWAVAFPAYLMRRRRRLREIAAATDAPAPERVQGPPIESLEPMAQLAALADELSDGLITEDEFQERKRALVRRMQES